MTAKHEPVPVEKKDGMLRGTRITSSEDKGAIFIVKRSGRRKCEAS